MKKTLAPDAWLRTWFAAVVALVFVVILLPRSGRIVYEPVTQSYLVEDQLGQIVIFATLMLLPLAIVYWGGKSNWKLEVVGWLLLIGLFSGALAKTSGNLSDKAYRLNLQKILHLGG
ncbi:MAG: hypothetical protein K0Q55_3774 [Verrucomicrobia bacterium]|jgi:hypothetical protein|nr:hypothetical protein [Verrucomicrobiota bacterium]